MAEVTKHYRFCELVDPANPAFAQGYVDMLRDYEEGAQAGAEPPGVLQKAANLAKAIVTHAVAGFPERSDEDTEAVLAICRTCEFNPTGAEHPSCSKCGCNMNIKARWKDQKCPVGKW
jgi:hypothetical protein